MWNALQRGEVEKRVECGREVEEIAERKERGSDIIVVSGRGLEGEGEGGRVYKMRVRG